MSDLIDRQAAIAYSISGKTREIDGEKWIRVSEVRESIKMMPSAQPEVLTCGSGELVQESDSLVKDLVKDCISRQAAIDALWKAMYEYEDKMEKQFIESDDLDIEEWILHRVFVQNMSDIDRKVILHLPSAQPEIVRCKDCKYSEHWRRDERMCSLWNDAWVFDDGFCNHAKRRTDET